MPSPIAEARGGVVTFDILVDGAPVPPTVSVMSISISREANRIASANLTFLDGEAAEQTFSLSEGDLFVPGKKVHLKMGYSSKNRTVFKGIITRHGIRCAEGGQTELSIECRDEAVKLTLGRKNKYFTEQKDSEVLEEIIGGHGLSKDIEATSLKHAELVQHHATDWDFILLRAEANGLLVFTENGKIVARRPKTGEPPALKLAFGQDILDFETEMDARTQWQSVRAQSWDYSAQQLVEQETSSTGIREGGNLSGKKLAAVVGPTVFELRHGGQALQSELDAWGKNVLQKSRLAKIRGRVKIFGFTGIEPGQMVELAGMGDRFNGPAFVSGLRHDMLLGRWDTSLQLGHAPNPFAENEGIPDFGAAGLVPPVRGLQIGKVVQLQKDPDGQHRILVRLPILDNNAQGTWARLAKLDAGNQRGTIFLPEIEDEVIVGFINDDPRDAIVLGQLHSAALPSPIEAKDTNHEKAIWTRSGMQIHFLDDSKTLTILTPGGNKITLDEKEKTITIVDQNGNKLEMKPAGIELSSVGELTIKAATSLNISAGAALKIEGASISAKGQGNVEISGALVKAAAQGIAEISGSLVKIN